MARAIWTGTITFGLVNIPVRVYAATRRKDVRFHEIDRVTGQRVHHLRVREESPLPAGSGPFPSGSVSHPTEWSTEWGGQGGAPQASAYPEVRPDEIVKGFEIAPGSFVTLSPEEIEELRPERTKTIPNGCVS